METRFAHRVNISMKITVRIDEGTVGKFSPSGGNIFEVDLVSISVLGLSTYSKYYLPKGLCVYLNIDGKPFGLEHPMNLKGEIRYCKQSDASKYKCGIKFIDIPNVDKERIAEFVERRRS